MKSIPTITAENAKQYDKESRQTMLLIFTELYETATDENVRKAYQTTIDALLATL